MIKWVIYRNGQFVKVGCSIAETLEATGEFTPRAQETFTRNKHEPYFWFDGFEFCNLSTPLGRFEADLQQFCMLARQTDGAEEILALAKQALMNKKRTLDKVSK